MAAVRMSAGKFKEFQLKNHHGFFSNCSEIRPKASLSSQAFRASQEPLNDDKNKFYKELGKFSLRKRIEDSVLRAEMMAPTALELEEARHTNQEEDVRDYDLWDDLGKSNDILIKLADSAKLVDTLRDLKYKAEEVKLITELADSDAINYALFKQAYSSSLDVNKFLDKYEMSKLLKEPYDMEGACITIESRLGDASSEKWTGQLVQMYVKWAERQGHAARIVERNYFNNDLKSCIIELEFKCAYGYLSGERGVHSMIKTLEDTSVHAKAVLASVDVIPLFIESSPDLLIDGEDVRISYPSCSDEKNPRKTLSAVHIQHIPTGLEVQSTGERSRFANQIKALNRLKAKLLVILRDQGISSVESIDRGAITDIWSQETRKYVFRPRKMVQDMKSGIQLPDVSAVLNGNLDPLIAAQIHSRQTSNIS